MFRKLILGVLFFSFVNVFAQTEDAWVYFNDKPSESSFIDAPLNMLTQRSLDRRTRYSISLDIKDVPVEASYITEVENTVGISVMAKSKWLNALHVRGLENDIRSLLNLSFVSSIQFADKSIGTAQKNELIHKANIKKDKLKLATDFNYGQAANQIEMLKSDVLHKNNFTGKGMQIAVIDAGFPNVNNFAAFQRIRDNNQILGGYDYVNRNENFYTGSNHGMAVLSTIAGYVENEFVGTAPDAEFYLFITEDSVNEIPLEESLWVEAAEEADRLGVDVINTSLGYSSFFDEARYNYSYDDMDGKTTFITRGAEIAFSRGMIVVNAAGNEGNDPWYYMNSPADGPSVLSIGAVDATGTIASFSSYGPTSDGRVKPDVCAKGAGVYIIDASGNIAPSNGTSFASPILTGAVTCLWQAFPEKNNIEITQLVKESAHLFNNPTVQEGYGIPNFKSIFESLFEDLDGDGISDIADLCPNTPEGAEVDTNGCLVLPSDNFNVEVIGETCQGKNNGQISISSDTSYEYSIIVGGLNYSLTNSNLTLLDLSPGAYEVCITLENQKYEQCYNFNILEGVQLSGKASVSSKSVIVELENGTIPYTVYLNGIEKLTTSSPTFSLAIKPGDIVDVKTSVACEGVFSKEIAAEVAISIYPNPINNIVSFKFPNDLDKIDILIYNLLGNTIYQGQILKNNPTTDISFLSKGFYLMQVKSNNKIETFKVLKN